MRYVLFPSWVVSSHDGQRHFIKAVELARLYDVPFNQCLVINHLDRLAGVYRPRKGDHQLTVRSDGNYKLPKPLGE